MKLTAGKDKFEDLTDKHEVVSWTEEGLGPVGLIDVKRSELIKVQRYVTVRWLPDVMFSLTESK